ncbi:Purine catabolism regulatory protein [Gordonia insulae]|uniref:Purine catabolism regulatory protein n=2 Tax=Gordonia insulae TaxID=2420509 RepID=A0A3G8JUX9_9ACTN|nr:Purine catabolism regulatory protein [Gordonia insulae]
MTLRTVISRHLGGADPHVLTAHDRLDVPVGWVHSSEIFEIGPLLSGGELLLTTGLGLGGLDAGTRRHYVRDLADRGVAGLAFEVGRTFDTIPEEMVREGSASRLPIIELRRVLPFIEVCRETNTAIVSGELGVLRRRAALDDALHRDLVSASGVAGMLAHVSAAAGRPVALIGSSGALLAAHGVDDDRSAWRIVDAAVAAAPVIVRDREIARLVAGGNAHSDLPDASIPALLDVAAGPVGAALTRSGTRGSAVGARLVEEIVGGRHIRRADLFARLVSAGVPVTESTRVVTVAAEAPDPRMAEATLARAAASLSGLVQATVDATVYALVMTAGGGDDDPVARVAAAIGGPGALTAGRMTAVVGDAHRLDTPSAGAELSTAMAESLRRSGDRLAVAAELTRAGVVSGSVFTGRELAAEMVVRESHPRIRAELGQIIAPLVEHDAAQSTSLVTTLEAHLRNGCSATRSAEVLHIGRQSLYQRLERIRGLLGFDPTSPTTYPTMLLAVSAFRADRMPGRTAR